MNHETSKGEIQRLSKEEVKQKCCSACYFAKGEACECKCSGAFHGLGIKKTESKIHADEIRIRDWELGEDFSSRLGDIKCKFCDADLSGEEIMGYPHESGWAVKGKEEKYWLFIICPQCHHQWSLEHLGIPRG